MNEKPGTGALLPFALLLGAGTIAAGTAALIAGAGKKREPNRPEPENSVAPQLEWFGGVNRFNVEALAFLFASENEHASMLVWALQALAANNFARQLGRSRPKIRSIGDMLQSGVDKKAKKRFYALGWGSQYDRSTNITRWGATSAGRSPLRVNWRYFEAAERFLLNKVDLFGLRGNSAEVMPAPYEWLRINSFIQHDQFGETVLRQAGPEAEIDPSKVVAEWGKPRLVIAVEGLHFYATGGR